VTPIYSSDNCHQTGVFRDTYLFVG